MQNFIKTIINAVQAWTSKKIKDKAAELDTRISESQADWDQNNENADDYVKNRTHYTETAEEVLVPRQTVDFSSGERGIVFPYPDDLVDATIFFDGKEYEWSDVLNNTHFESELFYVDLRQDQMGLSLLYFGVYDKETIIHTIGITRKIEIIHKLDKKYLDIDGKMDAINPIGEGSFSMNRKPDTDIGAYSHAEGYNTEASGRQSHAEGYYTTASGDYSHAEGYDVIASGSYSHAEGNGTRTIGDSSHAEGKFNISDTTKTYAHIVGNGKSDKKRSNAHALDWDGNAWYAGDVYVGSTSGTNKDEGSKKLATEEYVDTALENIQLPDIPTDEHINSLINTALGVIENGSY